MDLPAGSRVPIQAFIAEVATGERQATDNKGIYSADEIFFVFPHGHPPKSPLYHNRIGPEALPSRVQQTKPQRRFPALNMPLKTKNRVYFAHKHPAAGHFTMIKRSGFGLTIIALLGALYCQGVYAQQGGLKPGQQAPRFELKQLDGPKVSLDQLLAKGHVMLVFWETQCVYCYAHIQDFNAIQRTYHDKGLTVAAINFLGEYEREIRNYVKDNNVQYLVLADRLNNIDVAHDYKVIGSPTIVLIAPDGRILYYGYQLPDISQWLD
jgi:peroxiredoxin